MFIGVYEYIYMGSDGCLLLSMSVYEFLGVYGY